MPSIEEMLAELLEKQEQQQLLITQLLITQFVGLQPVPYSVMDDVQLQLQAAEAAVLAADEGNSPDELVLPGGWFSQTTLGEMLSQSIGEEMRPHRSGRIPATVRCVVVSVRLPCPHWACALKDNSGSWVVKDTEHPQSLHPTFAGVRGQYQDPTFFLLDLPPGRLSDLPAVDVAIPRPSAPKKSAPKKSAPKKAVPKTGGKTKREDRDSVGDEPQKKKTRPSAK